MQGTERSFSFSPHSITLCGFPAPSPLAVYLRGHARPLILARTGRRRGFESPSSLKLEGRRRMPSDAPLSASFSLNLRLSFTATLAAEEEEEEEEEEAW